MSLIPHSFLPRSMFDMDMWLTPDYRHFNNHHHHHRPSTLDIFDPFDELDRMMSRNMHWLHRPSDMLLRFEQPRVPNKYRINLDCQGYKPSSIKIDVSEDGSKLVVSGQEGDQGEKSRHDDGDYSHREFRRTFKLPGNLAVDKMASFVTANGQLVIEIPFKEDQNSARNRSDDEFLFPRIVDEENGKKSVSMSMPIPQGLDPAKIKVTCKDRDLIVQAEDKQENPDHYSQTYFYRRCTLPENTDFNSLKCVYDDNNRLSIKAPLNGENASKIIPIEVGQNGRKKYIKN
jgi:HSP20 family molecular chaperone IbpA